jgi:hypothetical protein
MATTNKATSKEDAKMLGWPDLPGYTHRESEAAYNLTWQWNNKDPGDTGSPLRALTVQYLGFPDDKPNCFNNVTDGVAGDGNAQQTYRDAYAALEEDSFWLLVARSASWVLPDLGSAANNLQWQKNNNINSLAWAVSYHNQGQDLPAIAWLLSGQRHNRDVMKVYRACFFNNGSGSDYLFSIASQILNAKGHEGLHSIIDQEIKAMRPYIPDLFDEQFEKFSRGAKSDRRTKPQAKFFVLLYCVPKICVHNDDTTEFYIDPLDFSSRGKRSY